ncbi:RNA demethylase alkbh9b [Stylosanthes scabra]|uniref:RNA demethylase alkbh9b n=1 Tax=Stylosanthes scabra TaxID=79078 RepID=A0ABU6ZQ75_9FABA|nr:RNA demethylase alkbh9b [Stylosanthes scabra]
MEKLLISFNEEEDDHEILNLLSDGFCHHCHLLLHHRLTLLRKRRKLNGTLYLDEGLESSRDNHVNGNSSNSESKSKRNRKRRDSSSNKENEESLGSKQSDFDLCINDGIGGDSKFGNEESDKQKECIRYSQVQCKKDFSLIERVDGRFTNVLQGLELHTQVFNPVEQKKIVECIYRLQWRGMQGKLKERTYSKPKKWIRGKGRVTIQFGCCYNYAKEKNGNPPGIVRNEEVDPLPSLFKQMIKRMVRWNIIPSTCIPDSCIVNIYDEGDCIPPHIDHHDFLRPFYTVSFLNQCNILFGTSLQVLSPGEFSGPVSIPLPVGSVFVINGNGANVAKHCIPSVMSKRISITFRKMDQKKVPYKFSPDPELEGIKPIHFHLQKNGYSNPTEGSHR